MIALKINQRHDCLVAICNNCFDTIAGVIVCSVANVFSSLVYSKYYLFLAFTTSYDHTRFDPFFPRNIY